MTAPRLRLLPGPADADALPHDLLAFPQSALVPQPWANGSATAQAFGVMLLRDGLVAPHDLVQALALHNQRRGRLTEILLARGMISEDRLFDAFSRHWQASRIDPARDPADPRLIDRLGAATCLRDGLLPWRRAGQATVIATAFPEDFARHRTALTAAFGPVIMALAPVSVIEAAILAQRGAVLDRAAQTRVQAAESCRDWGRGSGILWAGVALLGLVAALWLVPVALAVGVTAWAVLTLLLATALKIAATLASLRRLPPEPPMPIIARLPVVSVMVALYREDNIAPRLVRRLGRLDYPRELLDILLVVEQNDATTRAVLLSADLPPWMRVVVVPDGGLKTKPRALNYALDACRGSIIGVYDAEDAPAPDQIRRVVDRFHQRGAAVACLQGILDFYNPRTNWLSRCFTMEYASWFRLMLPGLARLGFAIPLGGTTLFFRRAALEELGGWDAHNVTEDADLGMRLARHGYRTELIDTVTEEEANCRTLPWIRQRSRWLKGYMMTYAVHMRDPGLLWRQLGAWKFMGFQVFFLTTLSQFLLAPVLWSFWLVAFGLPHPVLEVLPAAAQTGIMGLFLVTEAVLLVMTLLALRLTPNRINPLWALMLHFYFPLGALASYKAAWELLASPFFWDKTSHGLFDPKEVKEA
ncbi:glycosyltransferase [Rhodobacter ferrooxidans]|uniref:General secretory system II protein E domain protein n=1 Tax=Rhodobacter ferrooxidans TaxID=371731 RepID=C8S0F1_9RHOB|nr:glycosyltransferase [Rhodobacter sp. SW2]EEW25485.1 General secretory system II protein E domain protein [Rhodobacter sp. SW2]